MALELQLSTQKAQQAIQQINNSLNTLASTFAKFGSGNTGLDQALNRLAQFRGINPQAVQSLQQLNTALSGLARVGNLGNVAQALQRLATVNVSAVANNVRLLSQALAQVRVPPGLAQTIQGLAQIGQQAQRAHGSVQQLNRSLAGMRPPRIGNVFGGFAAGAGGAAGALGSFRGALSSANGVLAGFGVALGAVGFAKFISGAVDASKSLQSFKNAMMAITDDSVEVQKAIQHVNKTARDLGINVKSARDGIAKMAAAGTAAGFEMSELNKIFDSVMKTARVLGLSGDDVNGIFRAMGQTFSKGKLFAEELSQQLGDRIPGAIDIMERAAGVGRGTLLEMLAAGTGPKSDVLFKFAEELEKQFGKALPKALDTAQASFERFFEASSFLDIFEPFGTGFMEGLKPAMDTLNEMFNSEAGREGIQQLGNLIGQVFGTAALVIGSVVKVLTTLSSVVTGVGQTFTSVFASISGAFSALGSAASWVWNTLAQGFSALANDASVVGQVVSQAFEYMWQTVSNWASAVGSALSWIIGALASLYAKVEEVIGGIAQWFSNGIDTVMRWGDAVGEALSNAANYIGSFIENALNTLWERVLAIPKAFSGWASTVIGEIRKMFPWLDSFIEKIKTVLDWMSKVFGNGGGADNVATIKAMTNAGAYAGGGIAGSGKKHKVPSALFVNAPKLASGIENTNILAGGGIPAILHPNEAVVPLAGGGQIPVQLNGAGGDATATGLAVVARYLRNLFYVATETKGEIGRVLEVNTNGFSLLHNDMLRVIDFAQAIRNILKTVEADIAKLRLSGGGSGGVSGGSTGSFTGTGSAKDAAAQLRAQIDKASADFRTLLDNHMGPNRNPTSLFYTWDGAAYAKAGKQGPLQDAQRELARTLDQFKKDFVAQYGAAALISQGFTSSAAEEKLYKEYEQYLKTGKYSSNRAFATGSPNAHKDVMGGFQATLHPDEAVIPLPDGRAVPVRFPDDPLDRIKDYLDRFAPEEGERARHGTPRDTESSDSPTVIVHMTVNAADAGSFKKSQSQIMQELHASLQKAVRDIGPLRKGGDDIVTTRRG